MGDLKENNKQFRTVRFFDEVKRFEILNILEFDSDRKRMSVILKNLNTNEIVLYCKGAENAVFSKCRAESYDPNNLVQKTNDIIDEFAENGWRTLAFSFRLLNETEYTVFNRSYLEAYNDIVNRDNLLKKLYDSIETNLELIGATAVEDRLQDDVEETIKSLRKAGIKVWILTGDKKETAINISQSCGHFSKEMIKLELTDTKDPNKIKEAIKSHRKM